MQVKGNIELVPDHNLETKADFQSCAHRKTIDFLTKKKTV